MSCFYTNITCWWLFPPNRVEGHQLSNTIKGRKNVPIVAHSGVKTLFKDAFLFVSLFVILDTFIKKYLVTSHPIGLRVINYQILSKAEKCSHCCSQWDEILFNNSPLKSVLVFACFYRHFYKTNDEHIFLLVFGFTVLANKV